MRAMSKGVILGGDKNARGHRVLLPPGAMRELQRDVVSTCMVVVNVHGDVCGQKFYKGQEELAAIHSAKCAGEHADEIREWMARRRPDVMKPWDPEYHAWLRQHDQGIREGRVRW